MLCPPSTSQLEKDVRMWIHLLVSSKTSFYMRRQVTAFVMLLSSASGTEGGASPTFHSKAVYVTKVLMPFSSRLYLKQIFFLEISVLREMGVSKRIKVCPFYKNNKSQCYIKWLLLGLNDCSLTLKKPLKRYENIFKPYNIWQNVGKW